MPVEVEVTTVEEARQALDGRRRRPAARQHGAGGDAPRRGDGAAAQAKTEASGGITEATVRAVAETGVDYISVGAITHSAPALDISLEMKTPR